MQFTSASRLTKFRAAVLVASALGAMVVGAGNASANDNTAHWARIGDECHDGPGGRWAGDYNSCGDCISAGLRITGPANFTCVPITGSGGKYALYIPEGSDAGSTPTSV